MTAQSNFEASDDQVAELSNDELEEFSGGVVNVSFTMLIGEDSSEFASQEFPGEGYSNRIVSGQRQRSLFGLQFSGSFASMDHFSSFFSGFMRFFKG